MMGAKDFCSLQNVWIDSGAHPASYSMGMEALSQGLKWPRHEVDHSSPSSAKVKNEYSHACKDDFTFIYAKI
jgi:hypothetical protein